MDKNSKLEIPFTGFRSEFNSTYIFNTYINCCEIINPLTGQFDPFFISITSVYAVYGSG